MASEEDLDKLLDHLPFFLNEHLTSHPQFH